MVQANLQGVQMNFGPYLAITDKVQPPLPQHRPQQQQHQQQQQQQQIPRVQRARAGWGANNNDPLLVGILQTLTTNAQNHDRLAAELKLESHKYLMFPKTVFSGDNNSEAHQHWTNFEKNVTTQTKNNTLA